jgi:hypothetical protein
MDDVFYTTPPSAFVTHCFVRFFVGFFVLAANLSRVGFFRGEEDDDGGDREALARRWCALILPTLRHPSLPSQQLSDAQPVAIT